MCMGRVGGGLFFPHLGEHMVLEALSSIWKRGKGSPASVARLIP